MNIVVLEGVLSRPVEIRQLADGTTLALLDVATETANGRLVVPVAWSAPDRSVPDEGTQVVVTGVVRRRFFRAGGATQSRTEVVADAVVPARSRARARRALDEALAAVRGIES